MCQDLVIRARVAGSISADVPLKTGAGLGVTVGEGVTGIDVGLGIRE